MNFTVILDNVGATWIVNLILLILGFVLLVKGADFFVDDGGALKVNDYYAYYTWHCGDGQGRNGISNENSVGVEICVNRDGNYRRAVKNAAELVRSLMTELGIDASHVVRHYDASGKECPRTMMDDDWSAWKNFQDALASAD